MAIGRWPGNTSEAEGGAVLAAIGGTAECLTCEYEPKTAVPPLAKEGRTTPSCELFRLAVKPAEGAAGLSNGALSASAAPSRAADGRANPASGIKCGLSCTVAVETVLWFMSALTPAGTYSGPSSSAGISGAGPSRSSASPESVAKSWLGCGPGSWGACRMSGAACDGCAGWKAGRGCSGRIRLTVVAWSWTGRSGTGPKITRPPRNKAAAVWTTAEPARQTARKPFFFSNPSLL